MIATPSGTPPTRLRKRDLARGSGRRAGRGSQVRVHYVLVSWSTGQEVDSSWDRDEPFEFEIGTGQVIPASSRGSPA